MLCREFSLIDAGVHGLKAAAGERRYGGTSLDANGSSPCVTQMSLSTQR